MSESNLTFSGGRNLVAKKLQYNQQLSGQLDSPQFFDEQQQLSSQKSPKSIPLSRYQNILEKIQIDNNLSNYDDQLEKRLQLLEAQQPTERETSTYLNQAYKEYIKKSEPQRYAEDDYDANQDYQNYLKGHNNHQQETLAIDDIISHPDTLDFIQTQFRGESNIEIKQFIEKIIQVCELNFSNKQDQKLFTKSIKSRLTTSDPRVLSLNALEISTKDQGIYTFIEELVKDIFLQGQKQKQNDINSQIVSELMAVKDMLELKKVSLKREENRLIELEKEVMQQRALQSDQLQKQYEINMKQLEDHTTQKMNGINKRFHVIEHQLKTKLKLIESKGQLVAKRNQNNQSDVEKFKAKIFFLEKQLDSHKLKNVDSEKKILNEKDSTKSIQIKIEKLILRNTFLEKQVKELIGRQKGEDSHESSTLVVEQSIDIPVEEAKEEAKVVVKSSKIVQKTNTIISEEGEGLKASLLVLDGLVNSIQTFKHALGLDTNQSSNLLGEIMYPQLNSILSPLIDITPLVFTKHYLSDSCLLVSQILLGSILFAFDKKHRGNIDSMIPADELERIKQKNKSNQQHVNEVMQQGQRRDFEYYISSQSSYWKKKLKVKVVETQKKQSKLFQLTQNDEIQRELMNIFTQYIQTSEQNIKRTITNELQKFEISNSKFNSYSENKVLTSRSNICQLMLILAYGTKECIFAIKNITYDLRNENEYLSEYLKQYLTDKQISHLLVLRIQEDIKDLSLIIPAVELILELCSKGGHYESFLNQLSSYVQTFTQIFMINLKDNDLCEKLSIIIQRVLYTCGPQVLIIDLNKLESKMQEVRGGQLALLESNLKSIIEMVIHE